MRDAPPTSGSLQTEYEFELPRGYVDEEGVVHRRGTMRLATAQDELAPAGDLRVRANPGYFCVVLLSLVITRLGNLEDIHAGVIERFFAADLSHLQDLYRRINALEDCETAACPSCGTAFSLPAARSRLGES